MAMDTHYFTELSYTQTLYYSLTKGMTMNPKEKIDSVWNTVWKDILENPDGTPDMESIKRELHDYAVLFKSVQTAYSRLTGGEINHPFTQLDVLISYVDLYYE